MARSDGFETKFQELWDTVDDLAAGFFRQGTGPGTIRAKQIKPKSVIAAHIDVSTLESVQSKTGALSVTGSVNVAAGGSVNSGQSAYDTGTGYWIENSAGTPRFSLGNSAGNKLTWNGTTLAITGSITASSGTIGGWTIGASALTATNISLTSGAANTARVEVGTGANTGGVNSANAGTDITFWSGATHTNRATAPFRATAAGAVTMTSATVTGTITTSALTATGGTIGGLTIGASALTVGAGSKINFGASGADYFDDNLIHFEVAATETVALEWKNGANTPNGYLSGNADATAASSNLRVFGTVNRQSSLVLAGTNADAGTAITLESTNTALQSSRYFINAGAGHSWQVAGTTAMALSSTGNLLMTGLLHPGTGTANQTTGSLRWDAAGTRGRWDGAEFQFYSRIYPGNNVFQATGYFAWDGTNIITSGADFYVSSNYLRVIQTGATGSGALPNPTQWAAIKNSAGTIYYIPLFSAPNAWTV